MTSLLRFLPRALAAALGTFGLLEEARADAPTKEQCIAANEEAQTLRRGGKLLQARAELLACVAPGCPGVVRDDCAERLDEVERAIPSIVFTVRGSAGDLSAVAVTMDGGPLADHLGGSPLRVEPGEHTFAFASDGYATVTRTLVLREGVKGRQEVVDFAPRASAAVPLAPSMRDPSALAARGGRQRALAYALGGAGVVGLGLGAYFGLHAKATYDDASSPAHCPKGPSSCDSTGITKGQDAHDAATISTIAFVAGGALVTGALILAITAPKVGRVSVQPIAGSAGAGLRIGRTW